MEAMLESQWNATAFSVSEADVPGSFCAAHHCVVLLARALPDHTAGAPRGGLPTRTSSSTPRRGPLLHAVPAALSHAQRMASAARRELLCDAFCEYLEAAVHQLLYARGVYPRELFASFGLYGAEVFKARPSAPCARFHEGSWLPHRVRAYIGPLCAQCRHPEVAFYIHDTVASLREAIASGEVPRVAVVIHSGESGEQEGLNALERHVFEVQLGSPGEGRAPGSRKYGASHDHAQHVVHCLLQVRAPSASRRWRWRLWNATCGRPSSGCRAPTCRPFQRTPRSKSWRMPGEKSSPAPSSPQQVRAAQPVACVQAHIAEMQLSSLSIPAPRPSPAAWIEEDPELGGTELAAPAALHEPRTFAAAGLWLQTFSEVPRPD